MGTKGLIRLLIVLAIAGVIAVIAKFAGSDTGVSTVESKSSDVISFIMRKKCGKRYIRVSLRVKNVVNLGKMLVTISIFL